jgi:hypothetical protein
MACWVTNHCDIFICTCTLQRLIFRLLNLLSIYENNGFPVSHRLLVLSPFSQYVLVYCVLGVRFFCFIALSLPFAASFRVFLSFFSAFAKLRKTTISFIMSVRPPVRMEQIGSHWTNFHEFWYLSIFRKSVEKVQVSLKSDKKKGYFTWRPIYVFDHTLLSSP